MSDLGLRHTRRAALPGPRRAVLCSVMVESEEYGTFRALVHNLNRAGAFIETAEPLPVGTRVSVRFGTGVVTILARAVVRQHVAFNFADAQGPNALVGMTVCFTGVESGEKDLTFH